MKRVDLVFRAEFEFRIKPANPCWGTGFGWGTNTKPVPQPQVNPRLNPRVSDTRADPYQERPKRPGTPSRLSGDGVQTCVAHTHKRCSMGPRMQKVQTYKTTLSSSERGKQPLTTLARLLCRKKPGEELLSDLYPRLQGGFQLYHPYMHTPRQPIS